MIVATGTEARTRSPLRSVAVPNEHGGWGLTAEPVLLGLLLAPSSAGVGLGLAAVLAFLVRTPVKLISLDLRHDRWTDRSRLAARVAALELVAMTLLAVVAIALAGWTWMAPVVVALPLVVLEWSFDARGRGRRLVPELTGAVGIAAVAAAIVLAGDGSVSLAIGAWLVLAARAVGSIPFVRAQITRLRRGGGPGRTDLWQLGAVAVAAGAAALDHRLLAGAAFVTVLAVLQVWWVRRPPIPPKQLGFTQLGLGVVLVVVTAVGAAVV